MGALPHDDGEEGTGLGFALTMELLAAIGDAYDLPVWIDRPTAPLDAPGLTD
jgi:hypothetical protein